jgi:CDP-diglyceride synthetase
MARGALFDLLVVAGVLWLAARSRHEQRRHVATVLLLPVGFLAILLVRRDLIVTAAGAAAPVAALIGLLVGLLVATRSYVRVEPRSGTIVVRATRAVLLLWPGTVGLYVLARRGALWLDAEASVERLDGAFLLFVAALVAAERGWLYHAYRQVGAPTERQPR